MIIANRAQDTNTSVVDQTQKLQNLMIQGFQQMEFRLLQDVDHLFKIVMLRQAEAERRVSELGSSIGSSSFLRDPTGLHSASSNDSARASGTTNVSARGSEVPTSDSPVDPSSASSPSDPPGVEPSPAQPTEDATTAPSYETPNYAEPNADAKVFDDFKDLMSMSRDSFEELLLNMGKVRTLSDRRSLGRIADTISRYTSVLEVFPQSSQYNALVWGSMRVILQVRLSSIICDHWTLS